MTILIGLTALAVALLDGLVVFLQVKERDEWAQGHVLRPVILEGLTALAIGVTIIAFSAFTWWMIPPSVVGSMIGRWLAWRL